MLGQLQAGLAALCALAILMPASHNYRTDHYAFIWQSEDGPLFLFWLLPLATLALLPWAKRRWQAIGLSLAQCLLGLGVALVIWSLSTWEAGLIFSEIAWGGWVATGAAIGFAVVSAARLRPQPA